MHSIESVDCLLGVLVSKRHKDKIESVVMLYLFCLKTGEAGTTTRQSRRAWEHGTTSNVLHVRHVSLRCEPPGAPA